MFKILLKSGEKYIFQGVDEENTKQWVADISRDEFDETISDAVKMAVDEITSGASEAFDTLKEIEDWIKTNSGNTIVGPEGPAGADGKSAYQIWLEAGNEGSEDDFLNSLKGEKGALDEEQISALKEEVNE